MIRLILISLIAIASITLIALRPTHKTDIDNNDNSFVVVELFTSQGCSSCPSADRLLSELLDEAEKKGQNLYPLSFHVSYWNYLGWKDPYSKEQFTKRQRSYGSHFKLNSIYTPQAVVNGKDEFVGSSSTKARSSITNAFKEKKSGILDASILKKNQSEALINYEWSGGRSSDFLNIALVERHVENYVPKGENNGRTLKHDNVVVTFKQIDIQNSGKLTVSIPKKVNIENTSVILYVQDKGNFKIKAASQVTLK